MKTRDFSQAGNKMRYLLPILLLVFGCSPLEVDEDCSIEIHGCEDIDDFQVSYNWATNYCCTPTYINTGIKEISDVSWNLSVTYEDSSFSLCSTYSYDLDDEYTIPVADSITVEACFQNIGTGFPCGNNGGITNLGIGFTSVSCED